MKSEMIELKNLSLSYEVFSHADMNWRDQFVKALTWNFSKTKKTKIALTGINLKFNESERVGVLGANGAGKTSLFKIISGILKPTSGSVKTTGLTRSLFLSQNFLFPELTGRENARILIDLIFPKHSKRKEILQEAIDFSEIGESIDLPLKTYSAGMESRLLLSVLTAKSAEVLLIDEIFESADIFFKEKISNRMQKIIAESKLSLIVNHDHLLLQKHCKRGLVLDKGNIIFDGDIEDAVKKYLSSRNSGHEKK